RSVDDMPREGPALWTGSGVLPGMRRLAGTHKIVHRLWICGQPLFEGTSHRSRAERSRLVIGARTGGENLVDIQRTDDPHTRTTSRTGGFGDAALSRPAA